MKFISKTKQLFFSISNDYVVKIGKFIVIPKRGNTYISYFYNTDREKAEMFSFKIKETNKLLTDKDIVNYFSKINFIEIPIEYNKIEDLLEDKRLEQIKS